MIKYSIIYHHRFKVIKLKYVLAIYQMYMIPFQMRQVFSNLIGNAITISSSKKNPRIIIGAEVIEGPTNAVNGLISDSTYHKIVCEDNGIGFDPSVEYKIFEVLRRLYRKQAYEGTGIGLAIVKKIIQNHDGFVTASSKKDKGAVFSILLPIK